MIVFYNDKYIPLEAVSISPFDRGFLFADGIYESMRTYNSKLFKYEEHFQRLKRSLNEIQLRYSEPEKLEKIIYELIKKNNIDGEALIYVQITRGLSIPRIHSFPEEYVEPTVFISAGSFEKNEQEQKNGIKVSLQDDLRWLRCDIKSVSLLPVVLTNQKAKDAGGAEAILARDGVITEGTHTNFFAIKKDAIITAPISNLILAGITRDVVIKLANKLKFKVREEFIKKEELHNYNEFFITSTTKEVTPVTQIDEWIINKRQPGKVTSKLQSSFNALANSY
jgi:D-alanine transaminase